MDETGQLLWSEQFFFACGAIQVIMRTKIPSRNYYVKFALKVNPKLGLRNHGTQLAAASKTLRNHGTPPESCFLNAHKRL